MKRLSCAAARRRLAAFHDGELPVEEQIAVQTHVRACQACAGEARDLQELGELVRQGASAESERASRDLDGLQSQILNRLRVEREASVPAQVARAFEDMRFGLVAVGSTLATFVSILLMFGMLYFGPRTERSDSLAGLMETLSAQSMGNEAGMRMPRSAGVGMVADGVFNEEDAVLALSAVVTRGGQLRNLEAVLSEQPTAADRDRVLRLLDQVSRARFEPARVGGSAIAVRTVWLFAHTTVRGKMPITPKQSVLPRAQELLG
ncbi:MAG: zf-HC2 domain-containing protein [Acidobacteriota bacterium]